jgi:hypothetical protein
MKRYRGGLVGLAALLILAVAAPAANALVVHLSNGRVASFYLRPGLSAATFERQTGAAPLTTASPAIGPADNLVYGGGPVLHTTDPYLVFWDPQNAISSTSRQVLTRYLTDTSLDRGNPADVYAYRLLRQYSDTTGFAAQGQTFSPGAQAINDGDAYPAGGCSATDQNGFAACISDAQIRTELTALIATQHLPSGTGPHAPIYFVVTPQNVNVCSQAGQCASNSFCAYHASYTRSGTSTPVIYASIPFTGGTGCQGAGVSRVQEPNGDVADVIADNMSHENAEAITDPLPDSGWVTSNGEEVADQCEAFGPFDPNDPLGPTNPGTGETVAPPGSSLGHLQPQAIPMPTRGHIR